MAMSSTQEIKVVVFDLDDTLFPEHEFVYSGFQAVSDWILGHHGSAGFFEIAWQLFQSGQRGTIFNQTLDKLGIDPDDSLIQVLVQVYREHQPMIQLHHDAQWALDYLKSSRKIGLITNGSMKTQRNKVEALGIAQNFDAIVYCGAYEPEYWKPSPFPYLKLMELTGCQAAEHLYIGDHPYKDFVAAKALGWVTARICRQDGEYAQMTATEHYDASFKITSLWELKDLIG